MIQRVWAVVEAGLTEQETLCMVPAGGAEEIPQERHYRDERELAAALRRLADRVESGTSFEGCSFRLVEPERPSLDEAAAAMAAVDLFAKRMRPRQPRPASQLLRMLAELRAACDRLAAVTFAGEGTDEPL